MLNNEYIEKEVSFLELASLLGVEDFSEETAIDLENMGIQVESPAGFSSVDQFYVKGRADGYSLGDLIASGEHRTLVNNEWVKLKDNPEAKKLGKRINVVDISVPDGNAYIANGHVNHNSSPGGWN